MSRRREAKKRIVLPDPLYKSEVVSQFINRVMKSGKKAVAEKIVYGAFERMIEKKAAANDNVVDVFSDILDKVRPAVEVRPRRVGGATYQIPMEVPTDRGMALAMRWVIEAASKRSEKTMALRLAGEFGDILENRGGALKKSEDVLRMAKANQAFANFRVN
jgi:small subunit ribosomal protein S7